MQSVDKVICKVTFLSYDSYNSQTNMGGGTGCFFIPALKAVYMGGGTGCLPGWEAFHPGFT